MYILKTLCCSLGVTPGLFAGVFRRPTWAFRRPRIRAAVSRLMAIGLDTALP